MRQTHRSDTTVYVAHGSECLGAQVAAALDDPTIAAMPDVVPVANPDTNASPDVVVELGNDLAEQVAGDLLPVNLGEAGRLVVVDTTNGSESLDRQLSNLEAAGIEVSDVLTSTRPIAPTTLHPTGGPPAWTCGIAAVTGVGGFDEWNPELIKGELPAGTDAALVVGS